MATRAPIIAVLDADVLHPPGIRDLLLTVAEQGLYRPVWAARILNEMSESIREAAAQRSLAAPDLARVEGEMRAAFPEAELSARSYDRLVAQMTNHPKDRHVLAAAVAAKAAIIVSDDRKASPAQPVNHEEYGGCRRRSFCSSCWRATRSSSLPPSSAWPAPAADTPTPCRRLSRPSPNEGRGWLQPSVPPPIAPASEPPDSNGAFR